MFPMTLFHLSAPIAGRRLLLSGAAVAMLFVAACGVEEPPQAPEERYVRSMIASGESSRQATQYTAEVRARYETDLGFQVGGKIARRLVDVGAVVSRGELLAELDSTDQALAVDAARAAVEAANAELERAASDEARHRELLERGLTTRAAYLAQQTAVKTSQSRLEQATSDLRLAEQRLGYTRLRADTDGIVTQVLVEAGTVVTAGRPVLSLAQTSELELEFDVPDGRMDQMQVDAGIRFGFLGGDAESYPARLREISPSADPVTRTYQVRASIPEVPPKLRLGMSVTVTLPQHDSAAGVRLPSTALFQSGDDPAVWIVGPGNVLELRPVRVERFDSTEVLVAAGIEAGDRVVTAGVHRLADGEKVRLLDEARP